MSILKNMTVFLLFFCISSVLIGQKPTCGTKITKAHKKYLENHATLKTAGMQRLNKTISITTHVAVNSMGETSYTDALIDSAIVELNESFSPIALSFQVCKRNYMENYNYYNCTAIDEMVIMNYQPNTINLYLVNSAEDIDGGEMDGYTYLPTDEEGDDVIVVSTVEAIPHQMGHYLGLYDTHETEFGIEFVNASNCAETGDLICDTDADPYEENIPMDTQDPCNILENLLDPNGEFYVPPTNNMMSLYPYDCRCIFTNEQYNKMAATYLEFREYLW